MIKRILSLLILTFALTQIDFAQSDKKPTGTKSSENMSKIRERKPFEYDNESIADASGLLKRGAGIGEAKKVSLDEVLEKPAEYVDRTVLVEGVIVRSCKTEGCWMELAPEKDAKNSVRVTFKNHAFFIPLDSVGMHARAQGIFSMKTLSKEQVEHLVKEDGAQFENINKDGTVTEISFEAIGVELYK